MDLETTSLWVCCLTCISKIFLFFLFSDFDISYSCYVTFDEIHYNVTFNIPSQYLSTNNNNTLDFKTLKMLKQQARSRTGHNQSDQTKFELSENGTQSKSLNNNNNNNATTGHNNSSNRRISEPLNFNSRLALNELRNRFKPMLSYHKMLSSNGRLTEGEYCSTSYSLPATGVIDCNMFDVTDKNLYQVTLLCAYVYCVFSCNHFYFVFIKFSLVWV